MLVPPDRDAETHPAIVSLSRVSTVARPGQSALHDISLSVREGEILTLLGAGAKATGSTSGTSTILALIAGFARASSGQVQLDGRMIDATPTHLRGIGMVSRGLSLFPHLTVSGHARFAPGVTPGHADAVLHRLELSAFARRKPSALPPEAQVRTALARALAPGPQILLLEEPAILPHGGFAALKPMLRGIVAETGLSILHTSDDIAACFGFSDRIAVIQAGALRQVGTPQELYDRPESLAVAQAMGPINKLAGSVIDTEDDIARVRLAGGAIVEARFPEHETFKPGEACVVALRPERIAVASVVAAEMGDGAVAAKLIDTVFAGDQLRMRFSLDGKGGAAPEVLVTRPSGAGLARGNSMCLAWQPHHAHVFRTEQP